MGGGGKEAELLDPGPKKAGTTMGHGRGLTGT